MYVPDILIFDAHKIEEGDLYGYQEDPWWPNAEINFLKFCTLIDFVVFYKFAIHYV